MTCDTKVLIVEDNPYDLELIRSKLDGRCVLMVAKNAKEAVIVLEQAEPDVVLLDIGLPDTQNDMETIHTVKAHRGNAAIVILSGNDDPIFIRDSIRNSANGYLVKGRQDRTLASIIAEVDRAISNHQAMASLSKQ